MIYIMPKKKSKVKVEPEVVVQVVEPEPEHECACYSPETCSGECPAIEESGLVPEPELELVPVPEPEPVKKLRPCERVFTPEDLERIRLHREKTAIEDAEVIEYLESLK
tara:strand:+ start:346 stop:672 length:327 start_codon:yes stop_codon:yes gene_type:complete